MNDNVNESEVSAPDGIKSFRADAASEQGQARSPVQREVNVVSVRLSKYLNDPENQKIGQDFKFETLDTIPTVHTDSDWAGCRSSRSTSGGVVSTNIGVVKYWSSAQRLAALSSCQAQFHAINKGAAEATGIRSLAADNRHHVRHLAQNRRKCCTGSCQQAWRRRDAPL